MANLIMGHGVSGCFGTRLAPKTGPLKHRVRSETPCGDHAPRNGSDSRCSSLTENAFVGKSGKVHEQEPPNSQSEQRGYEENNQADWWD
jgi:hypothetical protein